VQDVASVIREYFAGEKSETFLLMLAGLACLVAACWLWFGIRQPFARGLAATLLLTAAIGLAVGGAVYFRTDAQVRDLLELQRADQARFAAEEGPRIAKVVSSFGAYRIGYAVAVLLAMVLVFVIGRPFHQGLAVGLLLLAALGFTVDFHAEARAVKYVQGLQATGAISPP
jgi:hypothetical protein